MALFKIVNNSVWQVLHFLCILAHFDMLVTCLVTSVPGVTIIAIIVTPVFNDALWPPDNPRHTDNDEILMICVLQGYIWLRFKCMHFLLVSSPSESALVNDQTHL